MSGSIQIGRVGTDGILLPDPEISYSGSQVTLSGTYTPAAGSSTAVADCLWLKEQILGLVDNDGEPVVPVIWSARDEFGGELDGFYRPIDATATLGTAALNPDAPSVPWTVTLERPKDYRQPRVEVLGVYAIATNSLGVTMNPVSAVPNASLDFYTGFTSHTTRVADSGTLAVDYSTLLAGSGIYQPRYSLHPAVWYVGGCRAQYDVDGTPTWRNVVGRQSFNNLDLRSDNAVRIDNGLVRIRPTSQFLNVEWYDGTQWDAATSFGLRETGTSAAIEFNTAAVLRSAPEEATLRLYGVRAGAASAGLITVDLTLRRGVRSVMCRLYAKSAGLHQVKFSTTTASTSLTGGLRRTSNNAGGNREILVTNSSAVTKDTTNGTITQTGSANEFLFGIAVELGGSSATGEETAANQVSEWFNNGSEVHRVVAS